MRKVLYILGELSDDDIEWMIVAGEKKILEAGETLIWEGRTADGLYILLSGKLVVIGKTNLQIAALERGEITGEMSIIEARTPNASVKAATPAVVLVIPRYAVQKRLDTNTGFAARFYKAMSLFLSDRLRTTTEQLLSTNDNARISQMDELDDNVLENIYLAGTRFETMMKRLLEEG
jgi:CRP/FNR family transcriptional regulator, cyclic AMP receptor protein